MNNNTAVLNQIFLYKYNNDSSLCSLQMLMSSYISFTKLDLCKHLWFFLDILRSTDSSVTVNFGHMFVCIKKYSHRADGTEVCFERNYVCCCTMPLLLLMIQ